MAVPYFENPQMNIEIDKGKIRKQKTCLRTLQVKKHSDSASIPGAMFTDRKSVV